jgi:hypothetical protein
MQLTPFSYALWLLYIALSLVLCALILQRRVVGRLRFFFIYLIVNLLKSVFSWYLIRRFGYASSKGYFYISIAQAVVYGARSAAIVEICYRILRPYRGVWGLAWRLLVASGVILGIVAGAQAAQQRRWIFTFVTSLERGLELAAAVTVVLLLGVIAYYRIRPPLLETWIAVGLATYSILQLVFQSLLQRDWLSRFAVLRTANQLYYQLILLFWLFALRHPVPAEAPAPALLDESVYGELAPQVNRRLETLNQRLMKLLFSRRRRSPPRDAGTRSEG